MAEVSMKTISHCGAWIGLLGLVLGLGCVRGPGPRPVESPASWREWRERREVSIAGTNGWLTLVGRHWLREGTNTVGAGPGQDAMLPAGRAPERLGWLVRSGKTVRFEAAEGVEARVEGRPVRNLEMVTDEGGKPTLLEVGPLTLTLIERGERVGLRVRDAGSEARHNFRGLDCFPYDPSWCLAGRFEPFAEPMVLRVPDVTGNTQTLRSPGHIVFSVKGRERRLQVVEEPEEERYFVLFRDRTAGSTTYGAGRYLYVGRADAEGRVTVDFNQAFTPPCAFTPYATCPLTPSQNELPFAVRAGERVGEE